MSLIAWIGLGGFIWLVVLLLIVGFNYGLHKDQQELKWPTE